MVSCQPHLRQRRGPRRRAPGASGVTSRCDTATHSSAFTVFHAASSMTLRRRPDSRANHDRVVGLDEEIANGRDNILEIKMPNVTRPGWAATTKVASPLPDEPDFDRHSDVSRNDIRVTQAEQGGHQRGVARVVDSTACERDYAAAEPAATVDESAAQFPLH